MVAQCCCCADRCGHDSGAAPVIYRIIIKRPQLLSKYKFVIRRGLRRPTVNLRLEFELRAIGLLDIIFSQQILPVSAMATSDNQNETQSRLYFLNEQLQKMVKELPRKYQQRIPNELLCELTECLLDKTLYSIVKELTDIQHVTEKQMFQKRLEMINKHSVGIQKLLKSDLAEPGKTETRLKLQAEHRKNLREFDKRIVTELDEKRREQQNTLHMAGVPGFDVTDDAGRIQVQIRLCDFIIRLSLIDKRPDEV